MRIVAKTSKEMLTFGLTVPEYACKCADPECDIVIVSKKLLDAYRRFRYLADIPLKINSGYRCREHNKAIGGVRFSYHLIGYAVDIDAASLLQKFEPEEIIYLSREAGFTFSKYYKNLGFFHFDVRTHNKGS